MTDSANEKSERALELTSQAIEANAANYSAWHYRTVLLPKLKAGIDQYAADLEMVQAAVFTEPDDQSAWMYHRWLLTQLAALAKRGGPDGDRATELLDTELSQCRELWEAAPTCKCECGCARRWAGWPVVVPRVVNHRQLFHVQGRWPPLRSSSAC